MPYMKSIYQYFNINNQTEIVDLNEIVIQDTSLTINRFKFNINIASE